MLSTSRNLFRDRRSSGKPVRTPRYAARLGVLMAVVGFIVALMPGADASAATRGPFSFKNVATGDCLTNTSDTRVPYTDNSCTQRTIIWQSIDTGDGFILLRDQYLGGCLRKSSAGSWVDMGSCTGSAAHWRVANIEGSVRFQNRASSGCLADDVFIALNLDPCAVVAAQRWR